MSISEISNNLFKNYYPCILPEYYMDQISEQIIKNQIDKLSSNFLKEKKEEVKNKKIKINQNMDYLREIAQKQGEWIEQNQFPEEQNDNNNINNEEDEQGNKSYDSNSENNSKNSYPEDESIVEEEEQEQDFDDKYDYYDNNDY